MKPTVEAQVASFLDTVLETADPDYVITVERKGTALLRTVVTLADSSPRDSRAAERRFVASDALHFMPSDAFSGKRILLLDDAMYQGRRIGKTRRYLLEQKQVHASQIKVAAFSVHEQVPVGTADYFWFGRLRDAGFRAARDEMVQSFQKTGSLLLATERIGVVAELNCGRGDFFDALCRLGTGVEWFSDAGRLNLTIHNPVMGDSEALSKKLPGGTLLDESIRKIRVVERSDGRFAICPIFYPSTPSTLSDEALRSGDEWLQALLGRNYAAVTDPMHLPTAIFQAASFFASVSLLEGVSVALSPLMRTGKVHVNVPSGDGSGVQSHLRMLFPLLDVTRMVEMIQTAVHPIKDRSRTIRLAKRPVRIDGGVGTSGGADLEGYHWRLLKQCFIASERHHGSAGVTWRQLRTLVFRERTNHEFIDGRSEGFLSTALDKAIDDAHIVTGVHDRSYRDGIARLARVFRPDGEMVHGDMRRICAMWKKDSPPPTWK